MKCLMLVNQETPRIFRKRKKIKVGAFFWMIFFDAPNIKNCVSDLD